MLTRNSFAAVSTALAVLAHMPLLAKEAGEIKVPADMKMEFAGDLPRGTLFKFSHNSKLDFGHPLSMKLVFFCPRNANTLSQLCYQQDERSSSSTSKVSFAAELEQPSQGDVATDAPPKIFFDLVHNKLSLTCRNDGTVSKEGFDDAGKTRLLNDIVLGQTKIIALPEASKLLGVYRAPRNEDIILTFPRYNFRVEDVGYYRSKVGDAYKYTVTTQDIDIGAGVSGKTLKVEGQGILTIPFSSEGKTVILKPQDGGTEIFQRLDVKDIDPSIVAKFGTPDRPKVALYDTPCVVLSRK